jgi:hypothetical protein
VDFLAAKKLTFSGGLAWSAVVKLIKEALLFFFFKALHAPVVTSNEGWLRRL